MKRIFLIILFLSITSLFSPAQIKDEGQKLLPVKVNGKWGFINTESKIVINPQFDNASEFSENLAPIQVGRKWGYINITGKTIIEPQFDDAGKFSEGVAAVQMNNNYGYVDKTGKLIIPAKFVEAEDFENGIAGVMMKTANRPDPKHSYVDRTGKPITDYDVVNLLSEGLILVRKEYKKGFIDSSGKEIIPIQYEDAHHFKEGVALIKENSKWGCIDKTGKLIISVRFDLVKDEFSEGMLGVQVETKWGFIDKSGEIKINPVYDDVGPFSYGLAIIVKNGKQGYVDKSGKVIIEPAFTKAFNFDKGIARVINTIEIKEGWMLIDKTGKPITKLMFVKEINRFEEDIACIRGLDNKYNYIDQKGNLLNEIKYDRAYPWFHNGIAQVFIGKKMGYINKTGKYIWEPSE